MGWFNNLQRWAPWALGLFLFAQLAGVIPLLGAHAQHILTDEHEIVSQAVLTATTRQVNFHHNDNNGQHRDHKSTEADDQCCTVHLLAAVVPMGSSANRHEIASACPNLRALVQLDGTDSIPLDRPPKLPLFI